MTINQQELENLMIVMDYGFPWRKSPEGHWFWDAVYKYLKDLLDGDDEALYAKGRELPVYSDPLAWYEAIENAITVDMVAHDTVLELLDRYVYHRQIGTIEAIDYAEPS